MSTPACVLRYLPPCRTDAPTGICPGGCISIASTSAKSAELRSCAHAPLAEGALVATARRRTSSRRTAIDVSASERRWSL